MNHAPPFFDRQLEWLNHLFLGRLGRYFQSWVAEGDIDKGVYSWWAVVMARYSHKGHNTIRYHTKYCDTIWYDTIQKCFTVCKNRMLSVTNYSYIVATPPIFTALTRSFEVRHGPTSRVAPPDTVPVWVNVSVATVNRLNRSLLLP